jgi:hypothetical protein
MKSSPVTRGPAPAERRPDLMPTRLHEPEALSRGATRLCPRRDKMTSRYVPVTGRLRAPRLSTYTEKRSVNNNHMNVAGPEL